jgi:hypothetical protein
MKHDDPNSHYKIVGQQPVRVHPPDALVRQLTINQGEWLGSITFHVEIGENGPMPTATARGKAQPYQLGLAAALAMVCADATMCNCAHLEHDVPIGSKECREIAERWEDSARAIIEHIGFQNVFIDGDEAAAVANPAPRDHLMRLISSVRVFLVRMKNLYGDSMTELDLRNTQRLAERLEEAEEAMKGVPIPDPYK